MNLFITGTRRGLGKALEEKYGNCTLEECDVFINCKHENQVDLLFRAAKMGKRIINIGSNTGDENKNSPHPYQIEKIALDAANHQLYYQGINTTVIRFGYIHTERVAHIDAPKMDVQYAVEVIDWVLDQPYRVKELTVAV